MKTITLFTLFLTFSTYLAVFSQAHAQTPSPTPNATDQAAENLKTRLKQTLNEEITPESSPRPSGYVGTVKDIVKNIIIFEDKDGKKNLLITANSLILRVPGNTEIDLASIRLEDSIIAMGYSLPEDEIDGRRIIVSTQPFTPPQKTTGFGIITEISNTTLTLTSSGSSSPLSLSTTKKTLYKTPLAILSFDEITLGDTIVYTALINSDKELTASVIMQIKTAPSPSPINSN